MNLEEREDLTRIWNGVIHDFCYEWVLKQGIAESLESRKGVRW